MNCYIFPNDRKTNQTTYYWFKNGFNDDEIRKVKDYIKQYDFQESTVFSGSDKSVRDSKIKWIDCNSETEWLYQKIYDYAKEANDTIYNFKSIKNNTEINNIKDIIELIEKYHSELDLNAVCYHNININLDFFKNNILKWNPQLKLAIDEYLCIENASENNMQFFINTFYEKYDTEEIALFFKSLT